MSFSRKFTLKMKFFHVIVRYLPLPKSFKIFALRCAKYGRIPFFCSIFDFLFRSPGILNYKIYKFYYSNKINSLPFKQVPALMDLIALKKIHEELGLSIMLDAGILLGAVRQGAFAGRPKDLDLFVIDQDGIDIYIKKIMESLKRKRFKFYPPMLSNSGPVCLKLYGHTMIDVFLLRIKNDEAGVYIPDNLPHNLIRHREIEWSGLNKQLTATLYGYKFFIPTNWESVVKKQYGKNWKNPDKQQLAWLNVNINKE